MSCCTPQGSKLWRLAYRFAGKQKLLALGSYPAVTLSDAQTRRDEAKRQVAKGLDPSAELKREKQEKPAAHSITFESVAAEFLSKTQREGKANGFVAN